MIIYLLSIRIDMIYFSFSSSFSLWLILLSYEHRRTCSFAYFLEHVLFLENNADEECERFSNSKSSVSGCCFAFAWFFVNFRLALFMKVCYGWSKRQVIINTFFFLVVSTWNGNICFFSVSQATDSVSSIHDLTPSSKT